MTNGRLEVLLLEAEGIKDRDKPIIGCLNCINPCRAARKPYVHILYGNQEHTSSVAKGRGKKKKWNEKFTFAAKYPDEGEGEGEEEDHQVYKVVFRIMDRHKYSDDEYVGETTVYVKEVLAIGGERGELEVKPSIYRVVEPDKTYTGQISIAISFLQSNDETEEEVGGWKESAPQE